MAELVIALDVTSIEEARKIVKKCSPFSSIYKIGPILFLSEGKKAIDMVKDEGGSVFLDLKFFDIPSVVIRSLENISEKIDFFTLHLLLGKEGILSIKEWAISKKIYPVGVTLLTSMSQESISYAPLSFSVFIKNLLSLAKEVELSAIVCHPFFIKEAKEILGEEIFIFSPAIRLCAQKNEHIDVVSPADAVKMGATHIICGRPIIKAKDPAFVCRKIMEQIKI